MPATSLASAVVVSFAYSFTTETSSGPPVIPMNVSVVMEVPAHHHLVTSTFADTPAVFTHVAEFAPILYPNPALVIANTHATSVESAVTVSFADLITTEPVVAPVVPVRVSVVMEAHRLIIIW